MCAPHTGCRTLEHRWEGWSISCDNMHWTWGFGCLGFVKAMVCRKAGKGTIRTKKDHVSISFITLASANGVLALRRAV